MKIQSAKKSARAGRVTPRAPGVGEHSTSNGTGGTGVAPVKFDVAPNFVARDGCLTDGRGESSRPPANGFGRDARNHRPEARATRFSSDVGYPTLNVGCSRRRLRRGGFTLLEVMFAVVAFCTATFAILALVSQSLETARRLQRPMVDSGLVASELSLTNKLVEGTESGDLGKLLGDEYKGYTYDYAVDEAQTNKLFQVVIALQSNQRGKPVVSKMTVLFYRPDSPAGSLDGGNFIK